MKPLPLTEIETIEDAKTFFRHLYQVEEVLFHPEDPFNGYIDLKTGKRCYTNVEAKQRDRLMKQCYDVCGDACEVSLEIMQEMGLAPKPD